MRNSGEAKNCHEPDLLARKTNFCFLITDLLITLKKTSTANYKYWEVFYQRLLVTVNKFYVKIPKSCINILKNGILNLFWAAQRDGLQNNFVQFQRLIEEESVFELLGAAVVVVEQAMIAAGQGIIRNLLSSKWRQASGLAFRTIFYILVK